MPFIELHRCFARGYQLKINKRKTLLVCEVHLKYKNLKYKIQNGNVQTDLEMYILLKDFLRHAGHRPEIFFIPSLRIFALNFPIHQNQHKTFPEVKCELARRELWGNGGVFPAERGRCERRRSFPLISFIFLLPFYHHSFTLGFLFYICYVVKY